MSPRVLQGTSGLDPATGMWLSRQQGCQAGFSLMVILSGHCEKVKKNIVMATNCLGEGQTGISRDPSA